MPAAASLDAADDRLVTVRGGEGVLTSGLAPAPPMADLRYLVWVEPGGEQVTIGVRGLSDDELLAGADGLEVVDAATWFALRSEPVPATGPAAEAAPATTTVPASREASDAPTLHVEGTYEGTEHYALAEEGPCDLDHVLDTTWTLTDGSAWAFHQEYCGLLDGDEWSYGGGELTLTAADGSTLVGDAEPHSALGPTYNDPDGGITLVVDHGTGLFAGAGGGCALDNHVTQVTLGVQRQDGTFACDLTWSRETRVRARPAHRDDGACHHPR